MKMPNAIASAGGENITLDNASIVSTGNAAGGGRMMAGVRVGQDGNLYEVTGANNAEIQAQINTATNWVRPLRNIDRYEAMGTSADTMNWNNSDLLNVWINCSTQPQWGLQRLASGPGTTTGDVTVQIRNALSLDVRDSGDYALSATEEI